MWTETAALAADADDGRDFNRPYPHWAVRADVGMLAHIVIMLQAKISGLEARLTEARHG